MALENASFGHRHLEGEHAHHHHLYFGPHEHPESHSDYDHDKPAPQGRDEQRRTATVSAAATLFQPVGASVPAVYLTDPAPVAPAPAPLWVAQPVVQPTGSRAPPSSAAAPAL